LDPKIVGEKHYKTARDFKKSCRNTKTYRILFAILGMEEWSEEDKKTVTEQEKFKILLSTIFRGRKLYRYSR